jgi:hypothetical protein
MSLLDLVAAAGEELFGLWLLRAPSGQADRAALVRRVARRFVQMTLLSLLGVVACWALARGLPGSQLASLAAFGVYVALAGAVVGALGWAYAKASLLLGAARSGRDA